MCQTNPGRLPSQPDASQADGWSGPADPISLLPTSSLTPLFPLARLPLHCLLTLPARAFAPPKRVIPAVSSCPLIIPRRRLTRLQKARAESGRISANAFLEQREQRYFRRSLTRQHPRSLRLRPSSETWTEVMGSCGSCPPQPFCVDPACRPLSCTPSPALRRAPGGRAHSFLPFSPSRARF